MNFDLNIIQGSVQSIKAINFGGKFFINIISLDGGYHRAYVSSTTTLKKLKTEVELLQKTFEVPLRLDGITWADWELN